MSKSKKPSAPPARANDDQISEALARQLAELALELAEHEADEHANDADAMDADDGAGHVARQQFDLLVRNALRKKNDALLYGAIEHARETDLGAFAFLRSHIEDSAASLILHRDALQDAKVSDMEITAFAVPVFVKSGSGLVQEEEFGDESAFAALVDSFKQAGLESAHAKVVLISHAYDLAELDRISFGELQEMLREAAASMRTRKLLPAPTLERSMGAWSPTQFGAHETALELRFLLGFALKRVDDAFYQIPDDQAQAEAYFADRMSRFRQWSDTAAKLVARCLARAPDQLLVHFLYQDLFFGARAQGALELGKLQLLAEVNTALARQDLAASQARAVLTPLVKAGQWQVQVWLGGQDDALQLGGDMLLDVAADLETELEDVRDALEAAGLGQVSVQPPA